jgi:hypothetical protein
MTLKRKNMFSGTDLTVANSASLSVRPQTKTEGLIGREYRKQQMVASAQAAKAITGQHLVATVIVNGVQTYAGTVENIDAIRTDNNRSPQAQGYVDDFCEHMSVRGGHLMAAAVEVGVKNIMQEVAREIYREDVKPGLIDRLLGRE